jgi:hypothetical protein
MVDVTEAFAVNKPRPFARPLADVAATLLKDSFARQGFASRELVTSWPEIVGADVAVCAEPLKIQWPRGREGDAQQPGTLVLRVEGPAAIEIQHLSGVILERVNRFFGWQAVGRLAIRQAPVSRPRKKELRKIDPKSVEKVEEHLGMIEDDALRHALGRLGAAIKRT